MRYKTLTMLIIAAAVVIATPAWSSTILATYDFPATLGNPYDELEPDFDPELATPMFMWAYYVDSETNRVLNLFDGLTLNQLIPGETYTIDSDADDPQWSEFKTMLESGPQFLPPLMGGQEGYVGIGQIGFMQLANPSEGIPSNGPVTGQFYGDFYLYDAAPMVGVFQGTFWETSNGPEGFLVGSQSGMSVGRIELYVNQNQYNPADGTYELSYTVTLYATPEPSSLLLLGTGLCGIAFAWSRRRRK